jgi:hypothetical protein
MMSDFDDVLRGLEDLFREITGREYSHYMFIDGKVVPTKNMREWGKWFENADRRIDYTEISNFPEYPGGNFISTVFLGIDHNSGRSGPPILFETMVFGGAYDQRGWRYASFKEAKHGHWQIVDCIKKGLKPELSFGEKPFIENIIFPEDNVERNWIDNLLLNEENNDEV